MPQVLVFFQGLVNTSKALVQIADDNLNKEPGRETDTSPTPDRSSSNTGQAEVQQPVKDSAAVSADALVTAVVTKVLKEATSAPGASGPNQL